MQTDGIIIKFIKDIESNSMLKSIKTATFNFAILLLLSIAFVSCDKEKRYPSTPEILSAELIPTNNAADIKVVFTDGDGDFGLDDNELDPPFHMWEITEEGDSIENKYFYNIHIGYEVKENGEWVIVNTAGSSNGRSPVITPKGQNKQIRATIYYHLQSTDFVLLIDDEVEVGDTIRYTIMVNDRALNESNVMPTNEYVIP